MPVLRPFAGALPLLTLAVLVPREVPAPGAPPDLVVYGRVWTGDSVRPWAGAVAISGDTVLAVGDSAEIARLAGPGTRVLSNGTAMVVPGFMDEHVHFTDGGFQLASVDLRPANSPQEFVARLKAYALERQPGEWILGGDWDHERWPGAPLPRREWIDSEREFRRALELNPREAETHNQYAQMLLKREHCILQALGLDFRPGMQYQRQ